MSTQSRKTTLFTTDRHNSVLNAVDATRNEAIAYPPYGDSPPGDSPQSQLRFNGELRELMTGHYPLGNGYRMYSPILMRFISPDNYLFSPFGKGGLNSYVYCRCDPVNWTDPTGNSRWSKFLKSLTPSSKQFKIPRPKFTTNAIKTPLAEQSIIPGVVPRLYRSGKVKVKVIDDNAITSWVRPEKLYQAQAKANAKAQAQASLASQTQIRALASERTQQSVQTQINATVHTPDGKSLTEYTNPIKAEKIQAKLKDLERTHTKEWQMDDYYKSEAKYQQQLSNLAIRNS